MNCSVKAVLIVILASLLAGCSTANHFAHIKITNEALHNIPAKTVISVVNIPQNDNYSCATTSVAMALSHYEGRDSNPFDKNEIWNISGSRIEVITSKGNDIEGLKRIAEHFQYTAEFAQNISLEELEYLISKGILVTLFIKVTDDGSRTHALLATGYDKTNQTIIVSDPSEYFTSLKYRELYTKWEAGLSAPEIKSVRACFILYPKGYSDK